MKFLKLILAMLMVTIIITSCKKEPAYDAEKQLAAEEVTIKAFLADNNITAQRHESGIYYVLSSPGTGSYAYSDLNTTSITVKYSGKLLNGHEFDASIP